MPESDRADPSPATMSGAARQLAALISGASAGVCIIFISVMLGLGSHQLDAPLRHGLLAFAIALPLLILSTFFVLVRLNGVIAYVPAVIGGLAVEFGIYQVLFHLDAPTGQVFIVVINACLFLWIIVTAIAIRQRRRSNSYDDE